MNFYKGLLRPLLFKLSPETAHNFTFWCLRYFGFLLPVFFPKSKNVRPKKLLGLNFPNSVGLAAGLDKNGKVYRTMSKFGFGFIELGTVTPKPQPGNPKPRSFRLPLDQGLINRMGFNNLGVDALVNELKRRPNDLIIGGNIGKNTLTKNDDAALDYLYSFEKLYNYVDYFVVNVSCPNIKDLRQLQNRESLLAIFRLLIDYRDQQNIRRPILLKVSPDLSEIQLDELIDVIHETGLDGIIATNTSVKRTGLSYSDEELGKIGSGGLSGAPIRSRALEVVAYIRSKMGPEFPIIASGGVIRPEDAIGLFAAGADLVQIYTGFIYEGPGLVKKIVDKL